MADPIKYSDLISPDNSITDLIAQLKELMSEYDTAKSKIQATAGELAKSMQSVSGATEDQRQAITMTAKQADQLAQEMTTLNAAEAKVALAMKEASEAQREQNQLIKLRVQLAKSEEGSYNALSAQYRILKIRINEMGEADEKAAKQKRELEAQARAVYKRMNELQTATGKYTLQVGNYERALGSALGVNGKFIEMLQDTSKASEMLKGVMEALTSPIGLVISAVGLATGAIKLWGSTIHETQQTGDAFDYAMAGWTSSFDYFKKAVATVDFTNLINGMYNAMTAGRQLKMVMDEVFEREGSVRIQKAMMSKENALLLENLRNTKLSNAKRIEEGKKYLTNIEKIYNQEIVIMEDKRDAILDDLFMQTNRQKKLSKEQIEEGKQELANYINTYNLNRKKIEQARLFNKALEDQNDWKMYLIAQSADEETKTLMRLVKQYDLTNNKQAEAYIRATEDYYNAQSAFQNENMRVLTMINSLEKKAADDHKDIIEEMYDDTAGERAIKEAEAYEKQLQEEGKKREDARKKEEAAWMAQLKKEQRVINLEIAATADGTEEMMRLRRAAINKAREIEIWENRQAAKEMRVDEALINAKYDKQLEDEAKKHGVKMGEAVVEGVAEGQKKKRKTFGSIWDILLPEGEDEEKNEKLSAVKDAVQTAVGAIMDSVSQLISLWEEEAQAAVNAADKKVESAERVLDAEREAAANGYANNVRRAEMELNLAKKTREKALKEEEKAQKARLALESISQAASLVTASANIWSGFSEIPIVGPALAIAAIALMWGSFLASKIKAAQVTKESYGEGTVELLEGGSHASGHDISLGRKKDGTERRAEGGEFFAVINKRNSRRYRHEIPDVINAFNDGTFAEKYMRANEGLAGYAVQVIGSPNLSHLEGSVDAIRKQGEARRSIEGDMVVVRYKNLTRRIKV